MENPVHIKIKDVTLEGLMGIPDHAQGIVIFAHGSGSSRLSPRNQFIAEKLQLNGFATLLFDLLSKMEDYEYMNRFNIDLLSKRLEDVTLWVKEQEYCKELPVGYFGASTGAAAALNAAGGKLRNEVKAVVSRGGRPDLAEETLIERVKCPVLLVVGELDDVVLDMNEEAYQKMTSHKHLHTVPGASHLFEESGTLEQVAEVSITWFKQFLVPTK